MALALYRKYRPRTFAEVIGQEHVTEPLSQALRSGRLHHAYLFSGPRGCGKTSSARILARSLNCEQGPTPEPCGVCISCKSLANDGGGSIDVLEIDAASHGGVDDARELREKAFFAPANSRFKIYVIDEAHMVSSAGFNALLKLVEEPPDYVKFIFATTEPDKVLGTIRSRTHHYPFRLIPPATLRPYLQQLTEAEGVSVEPAVFPLVVRAGGGSARDSLSVLDQLIAGAGPDGVSYARAVALLGVTDVALIDEMCDALAAGDGAAAYSTIDRVAEAGHDPRRFASDLLERLRDLIVLQQVPDAVAKGLIDGPSDQLEAMSAQATRLGPATLSRCADIVHNGLIEMRGTTAPRLLLELITARMLLPGAEDSTGSLLQRLERMERRLTLSGDTPLAVRGEPEPGPPHSLPASVSGGAPALSNAPVSGGASGGLSAARAAAAAARRASGAGPVTSARPAAAPVSGPSQAGVALAAGSGAPAGALPDVAGQTPASAVVTAPAPDPGRPAAAGVGLAVAEAAAVAPGSAVGSSSAAAGEPDWNQVAGGAEPVSSPGAPGPEYFDDEPPWDDEPESDQFVPPASESAPASSTERPDPAVPSASPAAPSAAAGPAATAQPVVDHSDKAVESAAAQPGVEQPAAQSASPARRVEPAGVLPDAPEEPGEAAVAAAIPGQLDVTAVREVWPEIITAIGRQSKKIAALASGATVRDFDGQTVVLTFRFPAHARMVAPEATMISNALYEALGGRWNIRCDVAGEGDATELAAPSSPGRQPTRSEPARQEPGRSESARQEPPRNEPPRQEPPPSEPPRSEPPRSEPPRNEAPRNEAPRQELPRNEPPRGGPRAAQGEVGTQAQTQAQAPRAAARAPQAQRSEAGAPAAAGGDDDWPEPARPGGSAAVPSGPPMDAPEDEDWPEVRAVGLGNEVSSVVVENGNGNVAAGASSGNGGTENGRGVAAAVADPLPADEYGAKSRADAGTSSSPDGSSIAAAPLTGGPDRSLSPSAGVSTIDRAGTDTEAGIGAPDPVDTSGAGPSRTGSGSRNDGPGSGLAAARAAAAGGRAPVARQGAKTSGPDGSPAEEAPYDPEYDGLPAGAAPANGSAGFEGFDPGDEPLDEVIDEKTARESSEQQAMRLLRDAFGAEKIGES